MLCICSMYVPFLDGRTRWRSFLSALRLHEVGGGLIVIDRSVTTKKAKSGKCTRGGFTAFKAKYAPDFGRTKLYQILAIGSGKKTREQVRIEDRERQQRHRAKAAVSVTPPVTDTSETGAAPQPRPDQSAAAMPTPHTVESPVTSIEDRKAQMAALAEADLTPEEKSDDALKAVKEACWSHCPKMLAGDLQKFRVFVAQYTNDLEKKMRKAA